MSKYEFTRLFHYMQDMRTEMNARFDETASKERVDKLTNTVDGLAKQLTDYHQEFLMLSHKVDRLGL
jgi:hypothetical protein